MKKYFRVLFPVLVAVVFVSNGVGFCGESLDKGELRNVLAGKLVVDASLTDGTRYHKLIHRDGTWVGGDERGRVVASGKWWINDHGQYCQTNNRTELNEGCVTVKKEGDTYVGYSESPPSQGRMNTLTRVAAWKIEETDRAVAYQKQIALHAMPAAGEEPEKKSARSWGAWGLDSENRNF